MIIMSAIGGEPVTTTVEGRERYTVNVRYARELRDDLDKLRRVLVPTMSGAQIPLEQMADIYAIWKWRYEMKRGTVDVSQIPVPHLRGH